MDKTNCINCGKLIYDNVNFCPYCKKEQTSGFSENELQKDPYDILQISREAEQEVVIAAYKSLSKKYHPDIDPSNDAQERMKDLNWSYSVLSNSDLRKEWDNKKGGGGKSSPQEQKSKTTTRTEPRAKYQAVNNKKKPQHQYKSTKSPSSVKKKRKDLPGKISAAIIIGLLILAILYIMGITTSSPSAYSPPRNTSVPTTIKQTPTVRKPTSTPKPPTATAIPDLSLIDLPYYEPFTTDRGLWYVGDDEEASFIISNGEYLIKPKKPGGSWWSGPDQSFDHIVLEFTTIFKYTYPSDDGGFYVNFRCENPEDGKCYTLFFSENGYLTVSNHNRILVDHGFSEHINIYDKPNEWAIVMDGNMFAIYCNNEFIVDFTNYVLQEGEFGFGVNNSLDNQWGYHGVAFDNIRVYEKNDPSTFRLPTPAPRLGWADYAATKVAEGYRIVTPDLSHSNPNWAKETLQSP